jgi:hypothetical protein
MDAHGKARGPSVDGAAAGSAEDGSSVQEETGLISARVTMSLSMVTRCDPSEVAGRKAAMKASLLKMMAVWRGQECRVEWTRGPSEDTLQQVLPLVVNHLEPESAVQLFQVCKPPPSHPPDGVRPIALAATHGSPVSRVELDGLLDLREPKMIMNFFALGRVVPVQLPPVPQPRCLPRRTRFESVEPPGLPFPCGSSRG